MGEGGCMHQSSGFYMVSIKVLMLTRGWNIHCLQWGFLGSRVSCFFFLIWSRVSCHGTRHLGPVWFDLVSRCFVFAGCQDSLLTSPIASHVFLFADLQVSWQWAIRGGVYSEDRWADQDPSKPSSHHPGTPHAPQPYLTASHLLTHLEYQPFHLSSGT